MEYPISPYNLAVRITTMEEAHEVVEWFESFGFRRQGLIPDLYLDYPIFYFNSDIGLLTGSNTDEHLFDYTIMEYEEWVSIIKAEQEFESEPINDDDFLRLLNLM